MSDKTKKGIVQAIASLMRGGMEREKIAIYIRATYSLPSEDVTELIAVAYHRLHSHMHRAS